ncbi:MAG: mannose-1-phosphate guanylyltransferase [Phycisphaeraceae bacterium]
MRYALIIAGGSGTRLWPMSTKQMPKQLIPFIDGRSLLQIAMDRLEGLLPRERIYICASEGQKQAMLEHLRGFDEAQFIGEPVGRDTLNAVGLGTAVLTKQDPRAVVAVFTADHLIRPEHEFRQIVEHGYELAEQREKVLVTFGIKPTHAATGFGYLALGEPVAGHDAFTVTAFKEKPNTPTAEQYFAAGPERYLWNSGMFVWRGETLLGLIEKYEPGNYAGLARCAAAWGEREWSRVVAEVYPKLKKISVDYAVMEPAAEDEDVTVAAAPMRLSWLDVGSWPSYATTLASDSAGNTAACDRQVMLDSKNTLVASSESGHLIATMGVEDLIVIHTAKATLICRADQAERIKELHQQVGERFGDEHL